jgi:hypothetical protein
MANALVSGTAPGVANRMLDVSGDCLDHFVDRVNDDKAVRLILDYILKMKFGDKFFCEEKMKTSMLRITKGMIEKYLVWQPGLVIAASAYHGPAGHLLPASMRKLSPDPLDPATQPLCKHYRVQTRTGTVRMRIVH